MNDAHTNGGMSAERVARNDAIFRAANEQIESKAEALDIKRIPFICECAEETCAEIVVLEVEQYEAVRREPTYFVNVRGHHVAAGPHARVVEDHGSYVVVEKLGKAGEIVTELDTRDPAA